MIKKEMIAMLLAGGQGSRLGVLTEKVAKPAVAFGGKYRIIDFPLSNCINSGIDTVGVLTQYQPLRLNTHIGIGVPWDLDRTEGGVTVLPPYEKSTNSEWYTGTANAIFQNMAYMEQYNPDYVLILSGDHIYKMDYEVMLDFHKANKADVTIACMPVPIEEASRFGIMVTDETFRVTEFEEKPEHPSSNLASMGIYIFSWPVLKEALYALKDQQSCDFGKHILPYCKDCKGHGPAWEHSLFEDNAEFAYGFYLAQDAIRKELLIRLENLKNAGSEPAVIGEYMEHWNDSEKSREVTDNLVKALEQLPVNEDIQYILTNKEYLAKKSVWAVGGDGWAYDIGFGGIDHVMAQNRNVNLLVLDTEVYSNTGGQSSKATPISATAKFAAGGKTVAKKDLGGILMQYKYVYVAQVAMGADPNQTLKALREAESYDGPSIVICYCPCLEQHIKAGMGCSQEEMKKAVECGYWHLYRYDPRRAAEGKNPFQLDSPEPDTDKILDFMMGENRYASLKNNFPEKADALYQKEIEDVKARYQKYKELAK